MKNIFLLFVLVMSSCQQAIKNRAQTPELSALVNPFIGTGGHGHTYPGATLPFGMMQLSPDTRLSGWDGCSGYHYSDSIIYGFSHTHLSGTGVSDYGDLLLMPHGQAGNLTVDYTQYAATFQKSSEIAKPGYYAVRLDDPAIDVELTTTKRCGMHRYRFAANQAQFLLLDLQHRDPLLEASIEIVDPYTIKGRRRSNAWAKNQHFYFYLQFSKPIIKQELKSIEGFDQVQALLSFDNSEQELLVKVGMSAVSEAGAQKNLEAEIPVWNFDQLAAQANQIWNKELSKVIIEGGSQDQQVIFYTALYHSFIVPNIFSDVDGAYRGTDLTIDTLQDFDYYTIFSLWDTFRGTHPLYTLLQRKRSLDFIKTMLQHYKDGGQLPVWELASNYTGCMIGYHAVSAIVDAYQKGIVDFDTELAFEAMQHSAMQDHLGLSFYKKNGFIACDEEAESVSKTLEYGYDDWCIAQMAQSLGKDSLYAYYLKRAQAYKNIFDSSTNFLRGRIHGGWFGPFDPSEVNFNYTEANGWQYTFFVPQDIQGLIKKMGGNASFEKMLDRMFETSSEMEGRHQVDITGLIGQYAHGNEPSHHVAYLYNYIQKPWKTQARVRQIMNEMYQNKADGLSGNEDCGQMSSWYNLSALGFYPVTPGAPYYTIGSPIFKKAQLNLENGKTFSILAPNASASNKYIQGLKLNGIQHNKSYINHEDILKGGRLVFEMGNTPNKKWGISRRSVPPSSIDEQPIVSSPVIISQGKTFIDSMPIQLQSNNPTCTVYYTQDGSDPNQLSKPYTQSIVLDSSCEIRLIAYDSKRNNSAIISEKFLKIDDSRSIKINTQYANQYAAGGERALVDQLRGGLNFRTGYWQGYQGDLVCVVDLGSQQTIHRLSLGLLQDIRSWIFYPPLVQFSYSSDGIRFSKKVSVATAHPDTDYEPSQKEASLIFKKPVQARFVRVEAANYGQCPSWHLGSGGQTWIFADELTVE